MLSQYRLAGIIAASVATCGPAKAQELTPPGSAVSIHKVVVRGPFSHTVKYYVTGGSPRLQALVRRVEWAENELSVIEQLQQLKLETVVNERRVAEARTAAITNPYFSYGFIPPPFAIGTGGDCASPLQRALTGQLAFQATPAAALQTIGFLEQLQTELDGEVKALPPPELKLGQDHVDALRPRVAALPRVDAPPPRPQPAGTPGSVATPPVLVPKPKVPQPRSLPQDPVAFQEMVRQNQEQVRRPILQTPQQFLQRQQEIFDQHQLLIMGRGPTTGR